MWLRSPVATKIIKLESEYQNCANNVSVVISNIKTQLLMNVCSLNVCLYSCKSLLLTIGSNGVSNSFDVPI